MAVKHENMRKSGTVILVLAICVAGTGCVKRTESVKCPAFGTESSGIPITEPSQPEEINLTDADPPSRTAEPAFGWYFKEGDFRYRMELLPGQEQRGWVQMEFSVREKDSVSSGRSNALMQMFLFDIPYKGHEETYSVRDKGNGESSTEYAVTVKADGTVTLQGGSGAEGVYYPYKGNLMLPDQYQRPLNATDLIGLEKEDLRLLRNEIYAVYGRKFSSPDLQSYFEGKGWYRGVTEPEAFDETVLGGMMKRNVAFLKAAEENWDEEAAVADARVYRALRPAPYLDLLPEHGEVLVNISLDAADITDAGIYYIAKGDISLPISISQEDYKRLDAGESVELTVDGLTGEKAALKKSQNPQYGTYCLGDESLGNYVEASYDRLAGNWYLWGDSADTRFKRVYEGDIYILKGATEEYFQYFDLPADQRIESPGNYRVMDFSEADRRDQIPYSGNILVADPGGYVKALYFWGD